MSVTSKTRADTTDAEAAERFALAVRMQEVEGNPLTVEELAIFAMFDREGLTPEECRAYILAEIRKPSAG